MNKDEVYRRHILDAIEKIEKYMQDHTLESLEQDDKTIDAVVRELEIIGEATAHFSEDFRLHHEAIPFVDIVGMRNHLIHEYFGVDIAEVFKTITADLPELYSLLTKDE